MYDGDALVAQLDRAGVSQTQGSRFESGRARQVDRSGVPRYSERDALLIYLGCETPAMV